MIEDLSVVLCKVQILNEVYIAYDVSEDKKNVHFPKEILKKNPTINDNGDMLFQEEGILIKKYIKI